MTRLLFLSICLFLSLAAQAQSLSGTVVDRTTKEGLMSAAVRLTDTE